MTPDLFQHRRGESPLMVSFPHVGTFLPDDIAGRMTETGRRVGDTDWHVHNLYNFIEAMDITAIIGTHSRYVADLNRDPGGAKLYPGRFETGVCPATSFHGEPLYLDGQTPDDAETDRRVEVYWQPYHNKLKAELARIRQSRGFAVLLDAHSILSVVPELFEGRLPDLNLGTANGASCDPLLQSAARSAFAKQDRFSSAVNGRFKGGYITRHYGDPTNGVHTLQLEMAMCAYLDEENPWQFDETRAQPLRDFLRGFVSSLLDASAELTKGKTQ